MVADAIRESAALWLHLLVLPFKDFDLLWRMIPIYLNGFLAAVYFPPSGPAAVFGGLTALWAGADWIRSYLMGARPVATAANWVIALAFCAFGVFSLVTGFKRIEKYYGVCGRRSILTFFAISLYPMQTGHVRCSKDLLLAIALLAVPVIVLLELLAAHARETVLKPDSDKVK
jgi:hypothetical protein